VDIACNLCNQKGHKKIDCPRIKVQQQTKSNGGLKIPGLQEIHTQQPLKRPAEFNDSGEIKRVRSVQEISASTTSPLSGDSSGVRTSSFMVRRPH
jgi:hypothetical protein